MSKLIEYARVSTRAQDADRQQTDLLAVGARRDDIYIDYGVSGARERRPEFDRAIAAMHAGDTLVITTLDGLGRSTANMLELAERLRDLSVGLKVLNLGGDAVDTSAPIGSMLFTVMAAQAQIKLNIKCERINDSVNRRRAAGLDLGGRREKFTRSQLEKARKLVVAGEPASHVARDLGMCRAALYRSLRQLPD